jgi:hypothetical protein
MIKKAVGLKVVLLFLAFTPSFIQPVFSTQGLLVENKGQVTDQHQELRNDILFFASTENMNLHLKRNAFSIELTEIQEEEKQVKQDFYRLDIELVGAAQTPRIITADQPVSLLHFYNTKTPLKSVKAYNQVTYQNIYPNIDLVFYSSTKTTGFKYDFVVHSGGNPSDIQLKYHGANSLALTCQQQLRISTPLGMVEENIPLVYALDDAKKKPIAATYKVDRQTVSYAIENYPENGVVIDPVLVYASYYGGLDFDQIDAIDIDNSNHTVVVGRSRSDNYIATSGAHQSTLYGTYIYDLFISRFNEDGSRLWSTYIGGERTDYSQDIVTDSNNNIYITGNTTSTNNFGTLGTHQPDLTAGTASGGWTTNDAILVKFDSNGNMVWGTYFGGTGDEYAYGLHIDAAQNILMTGFTNSDDSVSTPGAFQPNRSGGKDGFIARFDPSGTLLYGTYYGGGGDDICKQIAEDHLGNIYVAGESKSTNMGTTGAYKQNKPANTSHDDIFIGKFDASYNRIWGTYYGGGTFSNYITEMEIDSRNQVVLGGRARSGGIATAGAHQTSMNGIYNAYIAKFDTASFLSWGTYYGGAGYTYCYGMDLDENDNIYFSGTTEDSLFISTPGVYQEDIYPGTNSSGYKYTDAYAAKFDSSGTRLWGTYFGGLFDDWATDAVCDTNGFFIIAGKTKSYSNIATNGSHQGFFGGVEDGFIAKFRPDFDSIYTDLNGSLPDSACGGTIINVPFKATGFYESGNVFTAQLSDNNGSFSNAVNIGSISATASDTIVALLPDTSVGANYRIRVVSSNPGVIGLPTADSLKILVIPTADFSYIINGLNVSFTDLSGGAIGWNWDFGDNFNASLQNPSYTYLSYGTYDVTLVVTNGNCTDTVSYQFTLINTTGIESNDVSDIPLFPNPTSGMIQWEIQEDFQPHQLEVFNNTGQLVLKLGAKELTSGSVDISTFSNGLYLFRFSDVKGQLLTKHQIIKH